MFFLFTDISDVRAILQVLVDQISQQRTVSEQVISRVASLENVTKGHKYILNKFKSKIFKSVKNGERKDLLRESSFTMEAQPSTESTPSSTQHVPKKVTTANMGLSGVNLYDHQHGTHRRRTKSSKKKLPKEKKSKRKLKPNAKKRAKSTSVKDSAVTKPSLARRVVTKAEHRTAPILTPETPRWNALSSSEIDRTALSSIDEIVCNSQHYIQNGSTSRFALKLAREAVIGEAVIIRCTPYGKSYYPGLPVDSLYTIKQVILNNFPQFWDKLEDFEKEWVKCVKGIERYASKLRRNSRVTLQACHSITAATADHVSDIPAAKKVVTPPCPDPVAQNVVTPPCPDSPAPAPNVIAPPCPKTETPLPLSEAPAIMPITNVGRRSLPSCEIDKSRLVNVDEFMSFNAIPIRDGIFEMSDLAKKLALEVMFGEEVLLKCTPFGRGTNLHGFPEAEFNQLKKLVFQCYPSFWHNVQDFEDKWRLVCREPLSRMCSRLRLKRKSFG